MIGFPIDRETAGDILSVVLIIIWLIIMAALWGLAAALLLGIIFFLLSFA